MNFFKAAALLCIVVACTEIVEGQSTTPTPAAKPGLPAIFAIQPKVIEDPSVRAGWRRYQFGDDPAFSVILPSPPEAIAERTKGDSVVYLYMSVTDTAVYGAARMTGLGVDMERAPETERQGYFRNFIEGFAKGFQESVKKNNYELNLLDPKKAIAAGREAFQQDLTVGPYQGSAQLVFVGSGAFCVLSIWNPQSPPANGVTFFNSFQLTGTPK
ncbi:MAG: hypothetical protein ND895_00935 [Pyrinomonadaceae bacterium]|nr:hypothetical protein [Pyrinomonadaceae bacterium]